MKKNKTKKVVAGAQENTGFGYVITSIAAVLIAGIIAYSNSFDGEFVFDDNLNIVNKAEIRSLKICDIWKISQTRFLPNLSFALNHHFNSYDVWGYHFFNLTIHLLNAVLVYGLVRNLFLTPRMHTDAMFSQRNNIALFTALVFVTHPLATQSVTYIVQRLASMAAFFYFLSMFLYLKGRLSSAGKSVLFHAGASISALCAFMSKENSFTLPLAIALLEAVFFHQLSIREIIKNRRFWLIMTLLAGFFMFAFWRFGSFIRTLPPAFMNDYREISPLSYLLTQFTVIPKYIQLLLLPISQNLDYSWPLYKSIFHWQVISGLLLIIVILNAAILLWKKSSLHAFGILFFFLTLSV